jgi:hypothetical protein
MVLHIPRGDWWSAMAGSVAEVFRKVPREFLHACRACGACSDADIAGLRPGSAGDDDDCEFLQGKEAQG